jgi:hypothetical protein
LIQVTEKYHEQTNDCVSGGDPWLGDPFKGQEELLPVIDHLNARNHRLPWLENRRLVMALTPLSEARAGP